MRCPQCSREGTGKFCGACGSPLPAATPSDPVEETVIRVGTRPSADVGYEVSEIPDDGYTAWRTQGSNQPGYPPPGYVEPDYTSPAYVQPAHPDQYPAPHHTEEVQTAPLGHRFGAALLDGVIDAVLAGGVYAVLVGALAWWTGTGGWQGPAVVLVLVPSFLVALLLFNRLYRVGARGQSWGKAALRVVVVHRHTGEPVGLGRATVRALVYLIPLVPLTCFLDRSGELRTWADAAAGSRVVRL